MWEGLLIIIYYFLCTDSYLEGVIRPSKPKLLSCILLGSCLGVRSGLLCVIPSPCTTIIINIITFLFHL